MKYPYKMDKVTDWRKNFQGDVYRIHYTEGVPPPDGNYWVEEKPKRPKSSRFPLLPFIVRVRGETYHVKSKDAEAAARLFWSESQPSYPRRSEVVVESDGRDKVLS
jgi:hypothetical protein